jgi:hypothetical protein
MAKQAAYRLWRPINHWIWQMLNIVSQAVGVATTYTKNANDSISAESFWYREDRFLYRMIQNVTDGLFWVFVRQKNHCFEALWNEYQYAKQTQERFESRYGKEVAYEPGDPIPERTA